MMSNEDRGAPAGREYGRALLSLTRGPVPADAARDDRFLDLLAALNRAEEEGHVAVVPPTALTAEDLAAWEKAGLLSRHRPGAEPTLTAPLVYDGSVSPLLVYRGKAYGQERRLAERLWRHAITRVPEVGHPPAEEDSAPGAAERALAVERARILNFSLITGGPGTGKTTIVARVLAAMLDRAPEATVSLCAPTGKAAARLKDAVLEQCQKLPDSMSRVAAGLDATDGGRSRIESSTVHRLLLTRPRNDRLFQGQPLDRDLVVVDEASMLELPLAERLLNVVDPTRTRLLLLGDRHQLSAVGPGSIFADLCLEAGRGGALQGFVTTLSHNFRFAAGSPIADLAAACNEGNIATVMSLLEDARAPNGESDVWRELLFCPDPPLRGRLSHSLRDWIDGRLAPYLELLRHRAGPGKLRSAIESFRMLCAHRRGPNGLDSVNAYVEEQVRRAVGAEESDPFYPGRLIIVSANSPRLGLFNGDVGLILPAPGESGAQVWFEDGRSLPAALLPRHETAFALTIHQSQGSQFREVAVILPGEWASELATRELLYTGVTRARDQVAVFGDPAMVRRAVETPTRRVSGLTRRLRELINLAG